MKNLEKKYTKLLLKIYLFQVAFKNFLLIAMLFNIKHAIKHFKIQ